MVWATGFTGIKAIVYGWLPALVADLLWSPGTARRAGVATRVEAPSRAMIPAAGIALGLAQALARASTQYYEGLQSAESGRPGKKAAGRFHFNPR